MLITTLLAVATFSPACGPGIADSGTDGGDDTGPDAAPPPLLGLRRLGGPGSEHLDRMVYAPDGDLVLAGRFDESLDLGTTTVTQVGYAPLYLARYRSDGSPRWVRAIDSVGTGSNGVADLFVRDDGVTILGGHIERAVDLGDGPVDFPAGASGARFVAAYDADGELLWSHLMSSVGWSPAALGHGPDNGVVAIATMTVAMDLGDGISREGLVMANYRADGELAWARTLPATGDWPGAYPEAVGVIDGEIVVVGQLRGVSDYDGTSLGSEGTPIRYIARHDAGDGTTITALELRDTENANDSHVKILEDGRIVSYGYLITISDVDASHLGTSESFAGLVDDYMVSTVSFHDVALADDGTLVAAGGMMAVRLDAGAEAITITKVIDDDLEVASMHAVAVAPTGNVRVGGDFYREVCIYDACLISDDSSPSGLGEYALDLFLFDFY
jgi:hypothetical protein